MIEGKISGEHAYIARTYMDAPDVDGYVFIQSDYNFEIPMRYYAFCGNSALFL